MDASLDDVLGEIALVDQHCHGVWNQPLTRAAFESGITESADPPPAGTTAFDSQLGASVRRWCAPVLDLPPHANPDEYVERRARLGADEVNRRFLTQCGLAAMLVDSGFRTGELVGLRELGDLAGAPAREIVRLETVAEGLVSAGAGPAELVAGFPSALAEATRDAVAVKSIAAYRGGLDIAGERPAESEVVAVVARWLAVGGEVAPRLDNPVLLRFLLWCAVDRRLPVQLHCGFGDPDLTLYRSDPSRLTDFLRAIQPLGVPVVLLHNYPYHRQAAYLAQVFPQVYLDLGLALGYVGAGAKTVVAETLELAPYHKLLYSSDGFGLAELHYLGALRFRQALGAVLAHQVAEEELVAADAERIARLVGADNARRLYRL
jgi:predicted TIM-barrel fold metal-dependent hydrolase